MIRIIGIDPGSQITGFGIVEINERKIRHVGHDSIDLKSKTQPFNERLLDLHQQIELIFRKFQPTIMAIEKVFFAKNALSALKLGQTRGALILSAKINGLEVVEYSATEVKSAVVGYGRADKEQVQRMLIGIFGAQIFGTSDASDGLALAFCHAQRVKSGLQSTSGMSSSNLKTQSAKSNQSKGSSLFLSVKHRL